MILLMRETMSFRRRGAVVTPSTPYPRRFDPLAHGSVAGELLGNAARRLAILMWITGAIFLVSVLLYFGPYYASGFWLARVLALLTIALSIAGAVYLRRATPSGPTVEGIAIGYEMLIVLVVEIMSFWKVHSYALNAPLDYISWSCVCIVMFPILVPMTARKTLIASLAAASMSPVAMGIAFSLNGAVNPGWKVTASMLYPPFICAVVAAIPAKVMTRLSAALTDARQLGAYQLVERLGEGGMGEVWRARHQLLARPAAIKLIRPDALGAEAEPKVQVTMARFEREAQATAQLESPHTVELYDFGVSQGTFYYVMELVPGIDLEEIVRRYGPLPSERVVHLLKQACASLEEAHRAGLVHRDIKPANLIVGRRGRRLDFLRILDFGLVKSETTLTGAAGQLTAENVVQGTPAYLSPEAVTGDATVGPSSDIYALGCVAYWLLAGRMVFEGETAMQLALAHANKSPAPFSTVSEVPVDPALERVVMSCLAKEHTSRPESALALQQQLEACSELETWTEVKAEAWWRIHEPAVLIRDWEHEAR